MYCTVSVKKCALNYIFICFVGDKVFKFESDRGLFENWRQLNKFLSRKLLINVNQITFKINCLWPKTTAPGSSLTQSSALGLHTVLAVGFTLVWSGCIPLTPAATSEHTHTPHKHGVLQPGRRTERFDSACQRMLNCTGCFLPTWQQGSAHQVSLDAPRCPLCAGTWKPFLQGLSETEGGTVAISIVRFQ